MGGVNSGLKTGDVVVIGTRDINLIKQKQKDHGGWNPSMIECMDAPCILVQGLGEGAIVKGLSGNIYRINSQLLIKYHPPQSKSLKVGDKGILIKDIETIKKLQINHGGWSDLMSMISGEEVEIVEIFKDGDIYISKFGMEWLINPKCLEGMNGNQIKNESFKIGDIVQISNNILKSKLLQIDHGGWSELMASFAGKTVEIKSILPTGDVQVLVNDIELVYNPLLLTNLSKKRFALGDKVRLIKHKDKVKCLQEEHGEWVDSMDICLGKKGKVISIFPDGDLRVNILNQNLTLNPECVVETDSDSNSDLDNIEMIDNRPKMKKILSNKLEDSDEDDTEFVNEKTANFFLAVKTGNLITVSNLVDSILVNTTLKNIYPLMIAINEGHDEVAKLLITQKANLNSKDTDGDTALHLAVQKNQFELCELLIRKGSDMNAQNNNKLTPIMLAAVLGFQDILELLANSSRADLNIGDSDQDTALHLAVQKSQIESVETLLNAGADIKTINEKKFNSFHLAALRGDEKILKKFLKKGGVKIVDLQKEDKFAAIHIVALNNHENCLRILLQYKADINIRNVKLQTALHIAVSQKYLNIVKILVENNAEVNLKDVDGNTPLHVAMMLKYSDLNRLVRNLFGMMDILELSNYGLEGSDQHEEIVMYLMKNGARTDIKNRSGKTSLDLCDDDLLKAQILSLKEDRSIKSFITDVGATPVENLIQRSFTKSKDEEMEELRKMIEKLENEKICIICCDRRINITFGCGHMTCDACANNLFECHICRRSIDNKIRIYE